MIIKELNKDVFKTAKEQEKLNLKIDEIEQDLIDLERLNDRADTLFNDIPEILTGDLKTSINEILEDLKNPQRREQLAFIF